MNITIKFQSAHGKLSLNPDTAPSAPELIGWIELVLDPDDEDTRYRVDLQAWLRKGFREQPCYSMAGLGRTGALHRNANDSSKDGPHFEGHLGSDDEFEVLGWFCDLESENRCLWLEVRDTSAGRAAVAQVDNKPATSDQDLEQIVF